MVALRSMSLKTDLWSFLNPIEENASESWRLAETYRSHGHFSTPFGGGWFCCHTVPGVVLGGIDVHAVKHI